MAHSYRQWLFRPPAGSLGSRKPVFDPLSPPPTVTERCQARRLVAASVISFKLRPFYPHGKSTWFTHWRGGWTGPLAALGEIAKRLETAHGLDGRISILGRAKYFLLLYSILPGSGAHPVSYPTGIGGCYPWGKAAGAWSWPLNSIYCRGHE
jgi:hypothetical protein